MKRVLSILLVIVIAAGAFSMVAGASAPSTIIGFSGPNADMLDTSQVTDFGHLVLGDERTVLLIPLKWENFDFNGTPIDLAQVTEDIKNNLTFGFRTTGASSAQLDQIFVDIPEKHHESPADRPTLILTGKNIGYIEGEICLLWKGQTESKWYPIKGEFIDPTINKHIVEISGQSVAYESRYVSHNGTVIWRPDYTKPDNNAQALRDILSHMVIEPGDSLEFSLHTDHFVWDPQIVQMRSSVRKSSLDNDHVKAIKTILAGRDIVKSVGFENIDGQSAALVIHFKDDYPQTKEFDFSFNIALGMRGERNVASSVDIFGTFGNPEYMADKDNDYVFIGDGMIVEAQRAVRNLELDLDNGVSVFANLAEGKRYYGRSTTLATDDDRDIMNYFPSIRKVFTLKVTNLENAAKYVELHEEAHYYVYDADGKFLGMSYERLPFRTKYYLSTEILNFDVEYEESPEELSVTNPATGGAPADLGGLALGMLIAGALVLKQKKNNDQE